MFQQTAAEAREGYVAVGRVLRPHGTSGELRVEPFNPEAPHLGVGCPVHLLGERHKVERARWDRGSLLIGLSGIARRNELERAQGVLIEVAEADLVREDGSYFVHEIVGLEVVVEDGRRLGTVSEVLSTGANDVYVVMGEGSESLVPAIASVVRTIDVEGGAISITALPGLLDESE